jgi:cytochrome P450
LLPKGTNIIIIPTLPQFSTQVWGSTADQFDPDRFDDLPDTAIDPYAFQAFLSGPRICIGKAFALLEFKIILIELIRSFEFRATAAKVEIQKGGLSRRPVGGLMVGVRKL